MGIFSNFRPGAAGRARDAAEKKRRTDAAAAEAWRKQGLRGTGLEDVETVDTGDVEDDLFAFLYLGTWKQLTSSNVAAAKYDNEEQILTIEFLDDSVYGYSPVTEDLARELFLASSPGGFVWDELRIRGTVFGHQVNYWLISGPTKAPQRKWMRTEETRRAHGRIRPAGERKEKFPFAPKRKR